MAVVAGLIAFQKTVPWPRLAAYGTAAVLVCLGLLVLSVPGSLPALETPSSTHAPMSMPG
jgi:hypothetical protein